MMRRGGETKLKNKHGFTLLEIIICLLIVALIMGELLVINVNNKRKSVRSGQELQAYYVAKQMQAGLQAMYLESGDWATFLSKLPGIYIGQITGCLNFNETNNRWSFDTNTDNCKQFLVGQGTNTMKYQALVTLKREEPKVATGYGTNTDYLHANINITGVTVNLRAPISIDYYLTNH